MPHDPATSRCSRIIDQYGKESPEGKIIMVFCTVAEINMLLPFSPIGQQITSRLSHLCVVLQPEILGARDKDSPAGRRISTLQKDFKLDMEDEDNDRPYGEITYTRDPSFN